MIETLRWLLTVEAVGIAAFPVTYLLFHRLHDRGWGFARPFGLILVSFIVWILSYAGALPNHAASYWAALAVITLAGGWYLYGRRREVEAFIRREWSTILVTEVIFLAMFLLFVGYRAYDPAIEQTEKPMDFLFLNASTIASYAPPADPWLDGFSVAYYYFGYWIFAAVGQMAAVPTQVAFNLSIALIAGMAGAAIFSLVFNLVRIDGSGRLNGLLAGATGSVFLLVAANLMGLWEFGSLYKIGPTEFYDWLAVDGLERGQSGQYWRPDYSNWWWRATRVINTFAPDGASLDYTIQEFPFFSLILGDLHPHVMSMPFMLVGLGLLLQVWLDPREWNVHWITGDPLRSLGLAFVIGALGFINAWDIATTGALLFILATLKVYRRGRWNLAISAARAAGPALIIGLVAVGIFSPFYLGTFSSQVSPGAPIGAAVHATRPIHFFTVWGLPLMLVAPFVVAMAWRPVRDLVMWFTEPWRVSTTSVAGEAPLPTRVVPIAPRAAGALYAPVQPVRPIAPRGLRLPPMAPIWIVLGLMLAPFLLWAPVHLASNDGASLWDVPERFLRILPVAGITSVAMYSLAHSARSARSPGVGVFVLALIALSFYLLYGVELIFIRDFFGNRMNTIFKVYYQVWIFLAVAGAYALNYWAVRNPSWTPSVQTLSKSMAGVTAVLIVGALYYPAAAAYTKSDGFSGEPTLDGLRFIEKTTPAEREAIKRVNEDTATDATILEAVGGSYSEFGRISSATGRPTVLGWEGHEHQWRGDTKSFDGRADDVRAIYETSDIEEAERLLARYGVEYVYVGARERTEYSTGDFGKFDEIGERFFAEDGIVIYRLQERDAE